MNPQTQNALKAATQAVTRLLKECRKSGPLYLENPRTVAQVNRTGKWLLNALATLERDLRTAPATEGPRAG